CVTPLSRVRPQWYPCGSQESPSFHQPASELPHQFQPTRTSLLAAQNAVQLDHWACAAAKLLQFVARPLGPALMAISAMFAFAPFDRAQETKAEQASTMAVELMLAGRDSNGRWRQCCSPDLRG